MEEEIRDAASIPSSLAALNLDPRPASSASGSPRRISTRRAAARSARAPPTTWCAPSTSSRTVEEIERPGHRVAVNGAVVRVRDVADRAAAPTPSVRSSPDSTGREAVEIAIYREAGANIVRGRGRACARAVLGSRRSRRAPGGEGRTRGAHRRPTRCAVVRPLGSSGFLAWNLREGGRASSCSPTSRPSSARRGGRGEATPRSSAALLAIAIMWMFLRRAER